MSDSQVTRYEKRGPAAWITLASPATRNALSQALVGQLADHLHIAMADDAVRAVVLTAEGSAFSAGGNIKDMHDQKGIFGGGPAAARRG